VVKWDNRSLYKRLLPHMAVLTRGALRAWALGAVAVWGMRDGRGACAESEPFVAALREDAVCVLSPPVLSRTPL